MRVEGDNNRAGYVTDDQALARVCEAGHPRLVAALTHHVGDPWLAEDLAQEALVRMCDHWNKVRHLDQPMGWAFRVGVNLGSSWFRRRGAERRALTRTGIEQERHDPDSADVVAVRDALATLSKRQREVVILRFYLRMTHAEIAEVTGSNAGAVRVLVHRGVAALRTELGDLTDTFADEATEEATHVS